MKGFERDLNQPALRKAREWKLPIQIGILAGFGQHTTSVADLQAKLRLAHDRGFGVIFFYWKGLWGRHVPENQRIQRFRDLQQLGSQP